MEIGFIILAGGKSSRMGIPKHELIWKGKTFLQILYEKGQQINAASIFISYPEKLEGYATYPDFEGNFGPISGLYSIMKENNCDWYISVPIDTPQIPITLLKDMLIWARKNNSFYTPLSVNNYLEPIVAVFHQDVIGSIENMIKKEEFSVRLLSKYVNTVPYVYEGNPMYTSGVNTMEEYKKLVQTRQA
jgi:molybdenum cofactor guanylyltransferase